MRSGSKTADADRLVWPGIENAVMIRVRAGNFVRPLYSSAERRPSGPGCLKSLLSLAEKVTELPSNLVETAIALELAERAVVQARIEQIRDFVSLAGLYHAGDVSPP